LKCASDSYGALVWKDRPLSFHADAEPAALFASEARKQKGDKAFWEAHKLLFENQGKFKMENFEEYAKTLNLNWNSVKNAIENKTHLAAITADADLADSLKATGTPHMFINGRRISGAQPIENFKKIIDEEMTKAEALVTSGTAKNAVYEATMKTAQSGSAAEAVEKKDVPAPTADNPYKGGKNAKIIVQLFSDFECPFCGRIEPTMTQLLEKYGDKIQVVWRNLPLPMHKNAKLAAEAAVEVHKQKGNDGFWAFHDILFKNQRALTRADLEKYAEEVGCDMAKFRAALDNNTHTKLVEADAAIASKAGISGTPASVVNGYFLSGAQPISAFEKMIKQVEADLKKK
jgi:protein-disulfide isomerase